MKINVWYSLHCGCHCFASLSDECNYCYPTTHYTFKEACARYEADHEREHCQYCYIVE